MATLKKEKDNKFYNKNIKKMIDAENKYEDLYRKAIELISCDIEYNPRILDVGCGIGSFVKYLKECDYKRYVGIDFAEDLLSYAKEKYPEYKFTNGNLTSDKSLNSYLKRFNYFVSFEVLEHIEDDLKVVAALPLDSIFIFSVPSVNSPGHIRKFSGFDEVTERYGELLDFNNEERYDIIKKGKPHHHMFLFKSRRKR